MGYALRVDAHLQPRIAVEGLTFEVGRETQAPRCRWRRRSSRGRPRAPVHGADAAAAVGEPRVL